MKRKLPQALHYHHPLPHPSPYSLPFTTYHSTLLPSLEPLVTTKREPFHRECFYVTGTRFLVEHLGGEGDGSRRRVMGVKGGGGDKVKE